MADKPLFNLDTKSRWRLAYDRQQWILQRRAGVPCWRGSDSAAMRRTGWRAVSFIGSEKRVLARVLGEKGIILPERFMDFIEASESFAAQLEAEAA